MTVLDDLDRGLVHALQIDGRVPFSLAADVLGTSVQTITRRYHRLREHAGLRVVGVLDPTADRAQQWLVRLTSTPSAARPIAAALARRDDTSWVRLASGGTEIITVVAVSPEQQQSHPLLLQDIPRTGSITSVSAHYLLHTYRGGRSAWTGRTSTLTSDQQDRLRPDLGTAESSPGDLDGADRRLVGALGADARTTLTELAARTGLSAATVARRLTDLRARGTLFLDVELDDSLLGISTRAMLWMSVAPNRLEKTADRLSTHRELAFVAATTGATNLVAQSLTTDLDALHRYLTAGLGAVAGITSIESAPILQTLKANRRPTA